MHQNIPQNNRILHCPENLGNNAKCLSDREKSLGYNSQSISLRKDAFGFQADKTLVKSGSFFLGELARWRLLTIALFKYDVIHFNTGKTIMPHRVPFSSIRRRTNFFIACIYMPYAWLLEGTDLWLLKLFGKKLFFTFQGSDARLSTYYTKLHTQQTLASLNPDYLSKEADEYKRKRIVRAEHYAEQIFCLNPDLLLNFSTKARFMPYYNVDLSKIEPHAVFESDEIHIVHAPSKRDIKGTRYIIDAINLIQTTNKKVRFTLVENMSNERACEIYDSADILVDQLIVGWYGGVAVEAMARGVPTICYINDRPLSLVPKNLVEELPIVRATVKTIQDEIEQLIDTPKDLLQQLGEESLAFCEKYHTTN